MCYSIHTIEKKGNEMKYILALVLLTATLAQAQVYTPGPGYPLCFPQTVFGPTGPVTIVVCQ